MALGDDARERNKVKASGSWKLLSDSGHHTGSESATSKSASEEARVGTLGLLEGRSERIVSGFGEEAVSLSQNKAKIQ